MPELMWGTKTLLEEIDELLADLEDYTHGENGDRITVIRGRIESSITKIENEI